MKKLSLLFIAVFLFSAGSLVCANELIEASKRGNNR